IERDGGYYLFTIRLVPVFPYFVVNLLMGITTIRMTTFYWVSQLGMLPATIVYVNAGKQLGDIQSLGEILSADIIFAFVLLGLFPLLTKLMLEWIERKRNNKQEA
ncbi:MAG: VTT domain-containing protein, partial [Thiotrichales bacterium]|nr:VTT domain-containing protein [Thiotrichales bacterium]